MYTRWTKLCDWTCEHMFASLEVCNLKVHVEEIYCNGNHAFTPGAWGGRWWLFGQAGSVWLAKPALSLYLWALILKINCHLS